MGHCNHKFASDDLQDKSHHPCCPRYLRMWVPFKIGVNQCAWQKSMSMLSRGRPTNLRHQRIFSNNWPRKKDSWPSIRIKNKKKALEIKKTCQEDLKYLSHQSHISKLQYIMCLKENKLEKIFEVQGTTKKDQTDLGEKRISKKWKIK